MTVSDGTPPPNTKSAPPQPDPPAYVEPYVYAATDYAPRQGREIELCKQASHFDWMYTGFAAAGTIASEYVNLQVLKSQEEPGVRLIGPGVTGFFWGMFLSGGYLSLPKCDPNWAYGPPPEGNVRADWPVAITIAMVSIVTAPAIDYMFLGAVPVHWTTLERSSRVFIAMGTGLTGSLIPYLLPPRTWAARKEIERIRVGALQGGPYVTYGFSF
ncbi:MAG: hypothetical protein JWP97_75 [Labilithrix sp.]|nr:hypothetical protein [Labilithrix sp.]